MKKLLLLVVILAMCIPASAELLIYKMNFREKVFTADDDCPSSTTLNEAIWLVIDINDVNIADVNCGDILELDPNGVVADAGMFKTWKLNGEHLSDTPEVTLLDYHILDGNKIAIVFEFCDSTSMLEGTAKTGLSAKSLKGSGINNGTIVGSGTVTARIDGRLTKIVERGGEDYDTVDEVIAYLEDLYDDYLAGDACDPLSGPVP